MIQCMIRGSFFMPEDGALVKAHANLPFYQSGGETGRESRRFAARVEMKCVEDGSGGPEERSSGYEKARKFMSGAAGGTCRFLSGARSEGQQTGDDAGSLSAGDSAGGV